MKFSFVRPLIPSLLFITLVMPSFQSHALETPVIVNQGEASKLTAPTLVEFLFLREFGGETLGEAVAACESYRHAALAQIRDEEVQPHDIRLSPVMIRSSFLVASVIKVQYPMAVYNSPAGAGLLANLCDTMSTLATTLNASLEGPVFTTAQAEAVEAEVVARATENAYPNAEAISEALKSTIFAIEKVEILEVTWDQHPKEQYGETGQIACTARVEVTYMLTTQ